MSTDTTMLTIILSDHDSIDIHEDDWPIVARARAHAVLKPRGDWWGHVTVRRRRDGRALVYAHCWLDTMEHGVRDVQRAGEWIDRSSSSTPSLIDAIRRVHARISIDSIEAHSGRWRCLANECIADLHRIADLLHEKEED